MGGKRRFFARGTQTVEKRFTVSVAEDAMLEARAAEAGVSVSQFLVDCAVGRDRERLRELFALRGDLAACAIRVQEALKAGEVDPDAAGAALMEWRMIMAAVYEAIEAGGSVDSEHHPG